MESIIESRPGGHELLRSSERLLRLLGSARRYKIELGGDGKALYIVKYKSEELEEITRVIAYADLDVKKVVPMHKSTEAVLGSFATDDGTSIPPRSQRYFCETSSQYLESKVGICLDKEELGSSFEDLVEYAQQVAWVVSKISAGDDDSVNDESQDYEDVQIDCLKLVRRFLELKNNPPTIQQIAAAIPGLANSLKLGIEHQTEAVTSLKIILARGTSEHIKLVIDAGVIPSFSRLLGSSPIVSPKRRCYPWSILSPTPWDEGQH